MTEPVYCMFCAHCKYPAPSGLPEACRHPDGPRGLVNAKLPMCISMRAAGGICGPAGELYEKRIDPVSKPKMPRFMGRVIAKAKGWL